MKEGEGGGKDKGEGEGRGKDKGEGEGRGKDKGEDEGGSLGEYKRIGLDMIKDVENNCL